MNYKILNVLHGKKCSSCVTAIYALVTQKTRRGPVKTAVRFYISSCATFT